ncbi:MAG: putative metal-binding motif-containing protein [Deltaproteobacteria bacterium]|nr:putative metal-binding motif-containing protein [Deltaproteobacteria bacterium]
MNPNPHAQLRIPTLLVAVLWVLASGLLPGQAAAQQWTFQNRIGEGTQLDAVRGPNERIHLVAAKYYQIDLNGQVVVSEPQGDGQQNSMLFPPAIAAGDDGSVHLITRHAGSPNEGYELRYRRRSPSGSWDLDYVIGSPEKRNYVVGAAWATPGQVHLMSTVGGTDVWGDVRVWSENGGSVANLGSLTGIWRSDADARMRARDGRVYLVSGKCDPANLGAAYLSWGDGGAGLHGGLAANMKKHQAGTGRRGAPDLYLDRVGNAHFTYGAAEEVYYNQYDSGGNRKLASDVRIFDALGNWKLLFGLSAVASSDDGQSVVAVGLRTDGSDAASTTNILWTYSTNGGQTWSAPQDTGRITTAGEGRCRPRLVAFGRKFFMFFRERTEATVTMGTLLLQPDGDGDGYTSDVDCDDGNTEVNPGQSEVCGNQVDDDCDQLVDETCAPGMDAGTPLDASPIDPPDATSLVGPDSAMADVGLPDPGTIDSGSDPQGRDASGQGGDASGQGGDASEQDLPQEADGGPGGDLPLINGVGCSCQASPLGGLGLLALPAVVGLLGFVRRRSRARSVG